MYSDLEIDDANGELRITTVRTHSLADAAVSALATGGFTALVSYQFVGVGFVATIPIALLAALGAVLLARRRESSQLRVTRSELVLRGRYGGSIRSRWRVAAHDVQWLEFQEDSTSPETSHHPGGLYAVLGRRSVCLLPHVDESQTALVIERIEAKFPDLRARWASASPFGKSFNLLRLGESDARERK